ncbi:MAG: hypothetical protein H6656_11955 [Ardenticatenaceae bacterium]|nr:hypothetical protein [Ardenticatenaceae bacterium]
MTDSQPQAKRLSFHRKQLILPPNTVPGAGCFVPFWWERPLPNNQSARLAGAAGRIGRLLLRQPATVLAAGTAGRGRRSDELLALRLMLLLGGIVLLCGIGLLMYGRFVLIWLVLPARHCCWSTCRQRAVAKPALPCIMQPAGADGSGGDAGSYGHV